MRKIALFTALLLCLCSLPLRVAAANLPVINSYTAGQFSDVSPGDWYASYVSASYERGLLVGIGDGLFAPDDNIQLAAVVTVAARLHAAYRGISHPPFDQSTGTTWYATYVDYAASNGLLAGLDRTDYEVPARRREVACLLRNALPSEAFVTINLVDNGAIPDVPMNKSYAAEVYTLYRAGVLIGLPPTNAFEGESEITRGEVAAIFTRAAVPELRQSVSLRGPKEGYIQEVSRLINSARAEAGLAPLDTEDKLLVAAGLRVLELPTHFSSTRPDGSDGASILEEQGVTCTTATELIAHKLSSPAAVVADWMSTETKRTALLSNEYHHLAVGYHLSATGVPYWVLLLCD